MSEYDYLDLLQRTSKCGEVRGDRTGVGTIELFDESIYFDVSRKFPLLTTKTMAWKSTIAELLWFIEGSTNNNRLHELGATFWDEWALADGDLGPIYGKQLRFRSGFTWVKPDIRTPEALRELPELLSPTGVRNLNARNTYGVGYMGDYDKGDAHYDLLVNTWRQMIRRCYDESCRAYPGYGGKGVHVHEDWHCFANFQRDAKKLYGWADRLEYPGEYSLDKDAKRAANYYSKDTCIWAHKNVQDANTSTTRPFQATSPDGEVVEFYSIGRASRDYGINVSAVHRCLNSKLKSHHGWTNFAYITGGDGLVPRYFEVDQLKSLISGIKHDPYSRRHIMSTWNPEEEAFMQLPPCHGLVSQFYVTNDGCLDMSMYQRSGDMFLGVPVNIASYALLLRMIAQVTGYKARGLSINIGCAHVYLNHLDQVNEQMGRAPRGFPKLEIDPSIKDIDDFTFESFKLVGYDPHPAIKAPVAV